MSSSRHWGASAASGPEDRDYESMSNEDILELQKTEMARQDEAIDFIHESVKRQKGLATTIRTELEDQDRLLDQLDKHVDESNSRVEEETLHVRQVEKKARQNGLLSIICVLFLVIIVVSILAGALP